MVSLRRSAKPLSISSLKRRRSSLYNLNRYQQLHRTIDRFPDPPPTIYSFFFVFSFGCFSQSTGFPEKRNGMTVIFSLSFIRFVCRNSNGPLRFRDRISACMFPVFFRNFMTRVQLRICRQRRASCLETFLAHS